MEGIASRTRVPTSALERGRQQCASCHGALARSGSQVTPSPPPKPPLWPQVRTASTWGVRSLVSGEFGGREMASAMLIIESLLQFLYPCLGPGLGNAKGDDAGDGGGLEGQQAAGRATGNRSARGGGGSPGDSPSGSLEEGSGGGDEGSPERGFAGQEVGSGRHGRQRWRPNLFGQSFRAGRLAADGNPKAAAIKAARPSKAAESSPVLTLRELRGAVLDALVHGNENATGIFGRFAEPVAGRPGVEAITPAGFQRLVEIRWDPVPGVPHSWPSLALSLWTCALLFP